MIYNAMLVFAVQQSESVICVCVCIYIYIHISTFFKDAFPILVITEY